MSKEATPILEQLPYGFRFGPLTVSRVHHDDRTGWWVAVEVIGRTGVVIGCSPKGRKLSVKKPWVKQ